MAVSSVEESTPAKCTVAEKHRAVVLVVPVIYLGEGLGRNR